MCTEPSQANMENASKGQDKTKNTKKNLERKPSIKLKTMPAVRQTLTSYKRMLQANPLLKYQEAGVNIDELFKLGGNASKMGTSSDGDFKACTLEGRASIRDFKKPETKPLVRTQSLKLTKSNGLDIGKKSSTAVPGNQPYKSNFKRPPVKNINDGENIIRSLAKPKEVTSKYSVGYKVEYKKPLGEIKAKVNTFSKNFNRSSTHTSKPESKYPPKKQTSSLRRSLSAGHIQSKKGKAFDPKQSITKSNQSQSEENISVQLASDNLGISTILEESCGSKPLIFKTPSAYQRRSVCHFTPRSGRRSSHFQASTPAPVEMLRLQERLNTWLKSRGKPLASFHHLKCFGIDKVTTVPTQIDDENKENIEVIEEKSQSYEDLKVSTTPESTKPDVPLEIQTSRDIPEEELAKVAKEAMVELQKLIEEDFPRAQCLGWLELIGEKYKKAIDEPEYWECRAAIEQSLGNAVEFYKTAIIKGAEVSTVDKSLDQLLKKFSLLNISPTKTELNKAEKNKEQTIREARTVFKSTIIQFAIQQRKLKKIGKDEIATASSKHFLVATPVKRSTRMSRSAYVSTPGVKLCTSLKEINLSSDEINFERNKALC